MTPAQLYCGLSAIWENPQIGPDCRLELELLLKSGVLHAVSHDLTQTEFLASRRRSYEHDATRYPNYFTNQGEHLSWAYPTAHKPKGSTAPLSQHLFGWAENTPTAGGTRDIFTTFKLRAPIQRALTNREGQAITWSYFEPQLGDLGANAFARAETQREISRGFTLDYMRFAAADIATGIMELRAFDNLAIQFPFFDVRVLAEIASVIGLGPVLSPDETDIDTWSTYVTHRYRDDGLLMTATVAWLIGAIHAEAQSALIVGDEPASDHGRQVVRDRMLYQLRTAIRLADRRIPGAVESADDALLQAGLKLRYAATRMASVYPSIGQRLDATRERIMTTSADLVILTATETEASAFDKAMAAGGHDRHPPRFGSVNTYSLYGPIGGTMVAHVRCTMGSGGAGGSALTVSDAVRELKPWAVIAVGLAFGVDATKQPIGQVLLSEKLTTYELQRVGESQTLHRGESVAGSPTLLGRFRDSHLEDVGLDVRPGEMLSGEKLIDNKEFKAALLLRFPDAIGGEMEGAGLLAASHRASVEWLVVKAVCDYAEAKSVEKAQRQALAAEKAVAALMHVLSIGGLRDPRR